ncbi:MFS transporter [Kutzneria kofuensis]|uniref:MFS family permease n=1 Tax=Kutzneria kofuensis TaxID=103725 RepID=A0A7W9KLW5_9PSEU|nr:MFS transporter [Kutzneria kofuensis]MBB5894865.1 MFS family permease [Kutzneria kofuensis]
MIPDVVDEQPTRLAAGTLVAGCFAVFLAQTGLVLPAAINGVIQRTLQLSGAELTWVSDAFLVPIAMFSLTFGVLGDRHGRKKVLLAGSLLTLLGATIAAVGGTALTLWAGQAAAGIGAAALFPSSLAVITAATPNPAARARGLAAWTTALSAGALVAPPLSGAAVELGSFHWAFGAVAVLSGICTITNFALVKESSRPDGRSLDWPGQITVAAALLALLFGMIEGPELGWTSPPVIAAFVLFIVLLTAFVAIENRSAQPMLRLSLFRIPAFSGAAIVAVVGMFGFLGGAYALSIRLGVIQHQTPLQAAGPFLVIQGVTPFIWPLLVRLLHRVGPRIMLVSGLLAIAAGWIWLGALPIAGSTLVTMLPALLAVGLGFGLLVSAITAAAVNVVPVQLTGMASATASVVRDLGQTFGPALIGTIVLSQAADALAPRLAGRPGPANAVLESGGPLAVATADLGPASVFARQALEHGYAIGSIVSAVVCVCAAFVALVMVRAGAGPEVRH